MGSLSGRTAHGLVGTDGNRGSSCVVGAMRGERGGIHAHVRDWGELLGNVVCMLDVFHHCGVDGNVHLCGGCGGCGSADLLLLLALDEQCLSV